MIKKFVKVFVTTIICSLFMVGNVFADSSTYSYYDTGNLYDNGTSYCYPIGSYSTKTDRSAPWTLRVVTLKCIGDYGIRFMLIKNDDGILTYCKKCGVWRSSTGWLTIQCPNHELGIYQLGVRKDDSYISAFSSTGYWSAG